MCKCVCLKEMRPGNAIARPLRVQLSLPCGVSDCADDTADDFRTGATCVSAAARPTASTTAEADDVDDVSCDESEKEPHESDCDECTPSDSIDEPCPRESRRPHDPARKRVHEIGDECNEACKSEEQTPWLVLFLGTILEVVG